MRDQSPLPQHVIDHFHDPYHRGACDHPTHSGAAGLATCGDKVSIQLRVVQDMVAEAWFDGDGCPLSQATASLLMERVEGATMVDLERLDMTDIMRLLAAEIAPHHVDCCRLALRALQSAIDSPIDEEGGGPTFTGLTLGDES